MVSYSRSVVSYLDILGFKKLIESETSPGKIAEILKSFRQALEPIPPLFITRKPHVKTLLFSDLALRVIDIPKITRETKGLSIDEAFITLEIIALARIQVLLISAGLIIRGGITLGEIYTEDANGESLAFGPAFVEAYYLEHNYAIYPRIVLKPDVLECALRSLGDSDEEHRKDTKDILRQYLRFDFDGIWHINYLGFLMHTGLDIRSVFSAHKNIIKDGLAEYGGISREASKYSWLAQYHNEFLNSLTDDELDVNHLNKEDLIIFIGDQYLLE